MIIKELNYIETAQDNSVQGGATGSAASVTVVGVGPSFATFNASAAGLSLDALGPFFSFDAASASAGATGAGLFGFGGNAAVTVVTV